MAEALAIIGLVSNIISFIDFGIKFASGARNVRDSVHGTTAEVRELELIVEDVKRYHERVKKQQASGQKLSLKSCARLSPGYMCAKVARRPSKVVASFSKVSGNNATSRLYEQGLMR
ncbi:uncharacterized protein J4E84_002756 [Alternaria hordeiaustralica]|uniref:uncharacterized protein n=1 Tax=Alternaria hordeiaustralica TaxID=1187925 RepID=UPI0020C567B3|nr:uncharacterized protein J4E84_002756 [Alternaria hordeiaustralica]KAI4694174.1 hypothetical protein J4E84_002756 [Alternaria hordeiaustralica]